MHDSDSRTKPLPEIWGSKGFQDRLKRLRKCRGMSLISNPSLQSTLSNVSFLGSHQWNKDDSCIASCAGGNADTDRRLNKRKRNRTVWKNSSSSSSCERAIALRGASPISEKQSLTALGSDRRADSQGLRYDNANQNDMKGSPCDSEDGCKDVNFMNFSTPSLCNERGVKTQICQGQTGVKASKFFDIQNAANVEECSSSNQKSLTEIEDKTTLPVEQRYSNLVKTMLLNDVDKELSVDMECYGPKHLPDMKRNTHWYKSGSIGSDHGVITESIKDDDTKAFSTSRIFMNGGTLSPWSEKKGNELTMLNPHFTTLSAYYGIDIAQFTQDCHSKMTPRRKQSRQLTVTGVHQKINPNASISNSDSSKKRGKNAIFEKRQDSNKMTEKATVLKMDDEFKGTKRMEGDKKPVCDVSSDRDTILSQRNSDFEEDWKSSRQKQMPNDIKDMDIINNQSTETDACCLRSERSTTTGNVFEDASNGKENGTSQKLESLSMHRLSQEGKGIANTKQTCHDVAKNADLIKSSKGNKISPTDTTHEKVLGQLTRQSIDKTDVRDHQLDLTNKKVRKQNVSNNHLESSSASSSRQRGVTNQGKCNESIKTKCPENHCMKKKDNALNKERIIIHPDTSPIKDSTKKENDSFTEQQRAMCENPMEKQYPAVSKASMEITGDFYSNECRKYSETSLDQKRCNWNQANPSVAPRDDSLAMESHLANPKWTVTETIESGHSSWTSSPRRIFSEEGNANFYGMDLDETFSRPSMCVSPYKEDQIRASPSDLKRDCSTISNQYPPCLSTEVLYPQKIKTFTSSSPMSPTLKDKRKKRGSAHKDILPSNSYVNLLSLSSKNSCPRDLNVGFHDLNTEMENNKKENTADLTTQNVNVSHEDETQFNIEEDTVDYGVQKDKMNYRNIQKRLQEFTKDAFIRRVKDLKKPSHEQILDTKLKDKGNGHVNNQTKNMRETNVREKIEPQPKEDCFIMGAKIPVLSKPLPSVKKYKPNVKIKQKSSKRAEKLNGKPCGRSARDAHSKIDNIKTKYDSYSQVNDTTDSEIQFLVSTSNHSTNRKVKEKTSSLRNGMNQTNNPNACYRDKHHIDQNFKRSEFQDMPGMETTSFGHPHSTGEIRNDVMKASSTRNLSNLKAKALKNRANGNTRENINPGEGHQQMTEWMAEDEKTFLPSLTSKRNEKSFTRGNMGQTVSKSLCLDGLQNQEMDMIGHHEERLLSQSKYDDKTHYENNYLYERPYMSSRVTLLDLVQTHDLWQHRRQSSGELGSQDEDGQVPEYKSLMSNAISRAKSQAEKFRGSMNNAFRMEGNSRNASNAAAVRSNTCLILPSIERTGNLVSQGIMEENDKNNSCADIDVDFLHSMNSGELHTRMGNEALTQYCFKQDIFVSCIDLLDFNSYSFEHLFENYNNNSKVHLRNKLGDRKSKIPVLVKKGVIEKKIQPDIGRILDTSKCSSSYRPSVVAGGNNGYSNHEYKFRDVQLSKCNEREEKHNINQDNTPNCIHKHNHLLSKCDLFCLSVSDVCDEEVNSQESICSVKGTCSSCNIDRRNDWGKAWKNDGKTEHDIRDCERAEEIDNATGSSHTSGICQGEAYDFRTSQDTMGYCITPQNHQFDSSEMDWAQSPPQFHHVNRDNDTDVNTVENDFILSNDDNVPEQTFLEIIHKKVAMIYDCRGQMCPAGSQRLGCRESRSDYDIVKSSVVSLKSNATLRASSEIKAIPKSASHEDVISYSLISNDASNVQHSNMARSRSYTFKSKHTPEPGTSELFVHKYKRKYPLLLFDNNRKLNSHDPSIICWPEPTKSEFSPVFSKRPRPTGPLQQSIAVSSTQLQCTEKQMPDDAHIVNNENSLQCTKEQMPNGEQIVNNENSLQFTKKQMPESLHCTEEQMSDDTQIMNNESSLQCTDKQMSDDTQIMNNENSLQCTDKQMSDDTQIVNNENSLQCTDKQMSDDTQIVNDENSERSSSESKKLSCLDQPEEYVQYRSSSSQSLTESGQGIIQRSGQRCPSMWPVVRKWAEAKCFANVDKINYARTHAGLKKGSLTFCSEPRSRIPFVITCLGNNNYGVHRTPGDPVSPAIDTEDAKNSTSGSSEDEDSSCSENSYSYQESDYNDHDENMSIHEIDVEKNIATQGVVSNKCKFESNECETDNAERVKRLKTSSTVDEDYNIIENKDGCRESKRRECTACVSFTLPPLSKRQVGKPHKEKWRRYY